jgi:hypothetical protein
VPEKSPIRPATVPIILALFLHRWWQQADSPVAAEKFSGEIATAFGYTQPLHGNVT